VSCMEVSRTLSPLCTSVAMNKKKEDATNMVHSATEIHGF
jgi:hypothetical protein